MSSDWEEEDPYSDDSSTSLSDEPNNTRFFFWEVDVLHNQPPARLLLIDRYGTYLLAIQQCRQLLASPESRRAFKLAVDKAGADVVEATPLELSFLKAHAGFPPKASSATLAPPAAIKAALRYRHYLTTDMERSFNLLRERGEQVLQLVPEDGHALAMLEEEEEDQAAQALAGMVAGDEDDPPVQHAAQAPAVQQPAVGVGHHAAALPPHQQPVVRHAGQALHPMPGGAAAAAAAAAAAEAHGPPAQGLNVGEAAAAIAAAAAAAGMLPPFFPMEAQHLPPGNAAAAAAAGAAGYQPPPGNAAAAAAAGAAGYQPPPGNAAAAAAAGAAGYQPPPVPRAPPAGPIPVELPNVHFTTTELHQRYGLKHVAPQLLDQEPLASERASLIQWLTADVQLDRQTNLQHSGNPITMRNLEQHLSAFLGFFYTFRRRRLGAGGRPPAVQLSVYRDDFNEGFLGFLKFMQLRRNEGDYMAKQCFTALRVISWLRAKADPPYDAAQEAQFRDQEAALNKLVRSLRHITYHKRVDVRQLQEDGLWVSYEELVTKVEQAKHAAIHAFQALPSSGGGNAQLPFAEAAALLAGPPSLGAVRAAQAWAKATYLVCLAGHLAPLRPAWFTNLYHPSHAPAACPQPHCRVPTCRGNLFYRLASDQYGVRIGHHKTSSHSSQKDLPPIQFVIPANVCTWLHIYFEYCHPLLADEGITNAFITLDGGAGQGQAFTPEKFNALVKRWLGINPKQIRHAFITHRRQEPGVPGPPDEGAAFAMGNSERAWNTTYYPTYRRDQIQQAQNGMGDYRQHILESRGIPAADPTVLMAQQLPPPQPQGQWLPQPAHREQQQQQQQQQRAALPLPPPQPQGQRLLQPAHQVQQQQQRPALPLPQLQPHGQRLPSPMLPNTQQAEQRLPLQQPQQQQLQGPHHRSSPATPQHAPHQQPAGRPEQESPAQQQAQVRSQAPLSGQAQRQQQQFGAVMRSAQQQQQREEQRRRAGSWWARLLGAGPSRQQSPPPASGDESGYESATSGSVMRS